MKKFIISYSVLLLLSIGTQAFAQPDFTFSDIDCGDIDIREMGYRGFTLRNNGTEAGTIYSMSSPGNSSFKVILFDLESGEYINLPYTLQSNQEIEIGVEFFPKDTGLFSDQIVFTTELGNHISHLRAHVVPSTLIFENTDFGILYINEEKTIYVTLKNTGKKIYDIMSIEPKNKKSKFFSVAGGIDLLPGTSWSFPVRFLSDRSGTFTDSLMIVTSLVDYYIQVSATIEDPLLGIDRVYDPSFTIAPNPATGFTTINLPAFKSQQPLLKIYDALGNEVADYSGRITAESESLNFDTRALPNGAYFVRISDGGYTLLRTFAVTN